MFQKISHTRTFDTLASMITLQGRFNYAKSWGHGLTGRFYTDDVIWIFLEPCSQLYPTKLILATRICSFQISLFWKRCANGSTKIIVWPHLSEPRFCYDIFHPGDHAMLIITTSGQRPDYHYHGKSSFPCQQSSTIAEFGTLWATGICRRLILSFDW